MHTVFTVVFSCVHNIDDVCLFSVVEQNKYRFLLRSECLYGEKLMCLPRSDMGRAISNGFEVHWSLTDMEYCDRAAYRVAEDTATVDWLNSLI